MKIRVAKDNGLGVVVENRVDPEDSLKGWSWWADRLIGERDFIRGKIVHSDYILARYRDRFGRESVFYAKV